MTISSVGRRDELGDFLRRRREALSPEAAGTTVLDQLVSWSTALRSTRNA